jgi:hypothetical protein
MPDRSRKRPRDSNQLARKRSQIIGMLCEGNSMSATARLVDVSFNAVSKLLIEAGQACSEYQDKTLRNLPQLGEIWAYRCEGKEVPRSKGFGRGDVVVVRIDADTRLVRTPSARTLTAPCWKRLARWVPPFAGTTQLLDLMRHQLGSDPDEMAPRDAIRTAS